jgi:hypothetical protein
VKKQCLELGVAKFTCPSVAAIKDLADENRKLKKDVMQIKQNLSIP